MPLLNLIQHKIKYNGRDRKERAPLCYAAHERYGKGAKSSLIFVSHLLYPYVPPYDIIDVKLMESNYSRFTVVYIRK